MDGKVDCNAAAIKHSSDEEVSLSVCFDSEFQCKSTKGVRCIPREWVNDGERDCQLGEDEQTDIGPCFNQTEFQCSSGGRCIPRYRVLDGFPDCADRSDETTSLTCIPNIEFRCRDNGRCIPRSWKRDTLYNCLDGSDEIAMLGNETCAGGEFRCHNAKRCIPLELLCDGMDHCGDCSDEVESCSEPRMFRCPSEPDKCIHWSYSCDPYIDCINSTDDQKSLLGFKCSKKHDGLDNKEKYCSIPRFNLMDEYSNCDDQSDRCYKNGTFMCTTCLDKQTIIAHRQICDGIVDCPDLTDECLCGEATLAATRTQRLCSSVCYDPGEEACKHCERGEIWCAAGEKCIKRTQVCDHIIDCPRSGIDEKWCSLPDVDAGTTQALDFDCDETSPEEYEIISKLNVKSFFNAYFPPKARR